MTNNKGHVVGTSRSKPVTEADIERMVAEAEAGYEARATADDTTTSEIIHEALRRFLHVA